MTVKGSTSGTCHGWSVTSEIELHRLRDPISGGVPVRIILDESIASAPLTPLEVTDDRQVPIDVEIGTIAGLPAFRSEVGGTYVMDRRPEPDTSVVRVWPTSPPSMWFEHRLVNEVLLSMASSRGLALHGALIARDGNAVAFAGPSFAGKSTLALTAIRTPGLQVLSEDGCLLSATDHGWVGFPGPRGVGIRDSQRRKSLVDEGDPALCDPVRLAAVVFLADRHQGLEPRCEAINPVDALPELTNQTFRARLSELAGQFASAAGVLRVTPAFRVSLPDDMGLVEASLLSVLDQVIAP